MGLILRDQPHFVFIGRFTCQPRWQRFAVGSCSGMTYADVLRPTTRSHALLYDLGLVLSGSLFIALSAQFAVPLPFSPVPVTGQTLAVLMIGVLLGSRRGSLSVLTYLMQGALGLPVLAGGVAGLARLTGPTGGYLIGFVAAAFLVGWLAERGWDRRFETTLLAMALGNVVIYACGLPWLARFVGAERVLAMGLWPFVPGDVGKILLATASLPWGWRLLDRRGWSR
jgi:biotin transport system substrate-specific component